MKATSLLVVMVSVGALAGVGCGSDPEPSVGTDLQRASEDVEPERVTDDRFADDWRCAEPLDAMSYAAKRVNESGQCADEQLWVRDCVSVSRNCWGGTQYVRDPSGDLWLFSTPCAPEGWTHEDPPVRSTACSVGDQEAIECSKLGESECLKSRSCYPLPARRLLESAQCLGDPEFVVCIPTGRPTQGADFLWNDPSGNIWSTGEWPRGWIFTREPHEYAERCASLP